MSHDDESCRLNDQDPQEEDQGQDPAAAGGVEAENPNAPAAAEVPAPRVLVAKQRNPAKANQRVPAQQVYALCPRGK
jgi:hypothetical protein